MPSTPRGRASDGARTRRRPRDPLLAAFDRLAARRPLAPLLLSPSRRATVADVDSLALAARGALDAGGRLPPGAVVAVLAHNGPGLLASLLALRRAGLAALLLDGQAPPAEAARVARALGASAVLRCASPWPAAARDWEATRLPDAGTDAALSLPDVAVVKLTSGSTGAPRGIATPVGALLADEAALARTMGLRADDRLVAAIPMSHSYGLSSLALPALVRGTPLVVPEDCGLLGPFAAAARLGATVLPTVPPYLDALLRLSQAPARPASLRLVIAAGAPLGPATAAGFREVFGLPVHVFYGASECGGICYDREGGAAERGSVGSPVEGVVVELGRPGAAASGGSVAVRSPAVAAGYVPEADRRLGGGRFISGDLGVWRNGELVLLGRQDGVVNVKGKKVNPLEVESVLADLPGVDEVVVLGVPVSDRGGAGAAGAAGGYGAGGGAGGAGGGAGGEVLRAVVACPPGRLTRDQVLGWCRERLAAYKVPRSLILLPAIPRTARGKIDRAALRSLRAPAGAPDGRGC
jgi:long-chain acyl-CoA synthetase